MQKRQETVLNSRNGKPVSGANVLVKTYPADVLATIYSDDGVTLAPNPLTTDGYGGYAYYAADGNYTEEIYGAGLVTRRIEDIQLEDDDTDLNELANTSDTSLGDALIGVKLDATGAVARTQHGKNAEIVTAGDFSNISTALTYLATLAAAAKKDLILPSGEYDLTASLAPSTFVDLVGEGRWNTYLNFALTSAGTCINMQGADTSNRLRSTLKRMRIDGTDCTDANVVGVTCNWNQSQQPLIDQTTIYGGYESGGASTGLKNGLVFTEDGSNWIVSFNELAIEGCHGDGLVIDTASGGGSNAINFHGGRIENNKGRNVVLIGPNDDIQSMQINFFGTVIEGASFGTTGVASNVHVQGVKANFDYCWFESLATPNWPTYEIRIENGRAAFHSCHWANSQRAMYVGGTAVLTGFNTIRSTTAGIHIAAAGRLVVRGEIDFLGAGTPITFDTGAVIDWTRDKVVQKSGNYTITTSDLGCEFTDTGTKSAVQFTLPNSPEGGKLSFVQGGITLRNSTYQWNASGSGTDEWYVTLAGGGNPGLSDPAKFYSFATSRTEGTVGALGSLEWGYGDNDTLGFSTIYFRTPADPDTQSAHTMIAVYPITIATSNSFKITPTGTSPTDSIVSDGTLGNSITLRCLDGAFWMETQKTGTWS